MRKLWKNPRGGNNTMTLRQEIEKELEYHLGTPVPIMAVNILQTILKHLPEKKEHMAYCESEKGPGCDCGAYGWNSYRNEVEEKLK
jgi:hypothetical protein